MNPDIKRRLAIEAEADRLAGIFERVQLLARARHIAFLDAGREAVAKGLVSLSDWDLLLKAAHDGS
ncbi:hypothetical protein [Belnapia moabensis]|uniref:hypothetical protein n=1 Tax=Belnapia moabensis TaxID=365533 RepID=UPI0005BDA72D|nr:hypothetical protein [Belnapia moabensis]